MNAKSDRNHSSLLLKKDSIHSSLLVLSGFALNTIRILCLVNITTTGCNFDCIEHLQYSMLYLPRRGCQTGNGTLWKTSWNLHTSQVPNALFILIKFHRFTTIVCTASMLGSVRCNTHMQHRLHDNTLYQCII